MSEELNEMSREQLVGEVLLVRSRLADATARNTQILRDFHAEIHDGQSESAHDVIQRLVREKKEAQARAERAEGEKLGLIVDCERLATDLEQALRQWKMYADERENEDLDKEDHIEAVSYRACVKTAKDWRDKAFSLTHPALTPAPQGRTDGERLRGQLPNSYGVWWWQSDGESAPAVVHIAQDSSGKFFATIGQYGWTEPQFVEDMGGLWVKCHEPQMVPFHEFEEAMDATAPEVKGGWE